MKLIVGLGNPGQKYQLTRHNIGFIVVDALADSHSDHNFKTDQRSLIKKMTLNDEQVLLVKPQTFMNLSGEAVRLIVDFYKIDLNDIFVIHDEVDLPFGQMKVQIKRGHGGHNGIRSIHQHLGTDAYTRLRMGVSRPTHTSQEVADYVLENFNKEEMNLLPDFLSQAAELVEYWIANGTEKTATYFNSKARNT